MFRHIIKWTTIFFLIFSVSLFITNDAFAKRFGGGKSFGMQRSVAKQPSSYSTNQSSYKQPLNAAPAAKSRFGNWGAALAGLAAGGLLSYLLMGHGVGASLMSWLAIAMVIMLIVQFIRQRRMQPANGPQDRQPLSFFESSSSAPHAAANTSSISPAVFQSDAIPGFNEEQFLRDVKGKFIRLQTAYDQKNLADIREFTTPDVFAEVQLQLTERGNIENYTEVLELRAELLEAINEFQVPVASVRFAGLIKEAKDVAPITFDEVWHFRGDSNGTWKIAGIQQ